MHRVFKDQDRLRRFKGACPYYRENWAQGEQRTADDEILLYEIYCLKGWPPLDAEEQTNCLCAARRCWRNGEDHRISVEESAELHTAQTA